MDYVLCYPYPRIHDDAWLKAAALYLPRIAGLAVEAPDTKQDSRTVKVLRAELDFFRTVPYYAYDVSRVLEETGRTLSEFVSQHSSELASRYPVPPFEGVPGHLLPHQPGSAPRAVDVSFLDVGKAGMGLANRLERAGLARRVTTPGPWDRFDPEARTWLAMDGRLAEAVLTVLTHAVARERDIRTVTDRSTAFSHLHTADGLAAALLPEASGRPDRLTRPIRTDDVRHAYAALAIRAVVPADLDRVPATAIVRARKTLRTEFDAFTAHLDQSMQRFEHIARSSDPAYIDADLHELFDSQLDSARRELESGLTRLGLRPVSAVLGARDLALPASAAALLNTIGASTAVTTAAGAAILFTSAARTAVDAARTQRHTAPGYLLGVREELTPKGVIDRFRQAARHRVN